MPNFRGRIKTVINYDSLFKNLGTCCEERGTIKTQKTLNQCNQVGGKWIPEPDTELVECPRPSKLGCCCSCAYTTKNTGTNADWTHPDHYDNFQGGRYSSTDGVRTGITQCECDFYNGNWQEGECNFSELGDGLSYRQSLCEISPEEGIEGRDDARWPFSCCHCAYAEEPADLVVRLCTSVCNTRECQALADQFVPQEGSTCFSEYDFARICDYDTLLGQLPKECGEVVVPDEEDDTESAGLVLELNQGDSLTLGGEVSYIKSPFAVYGTTARFGTGYYYPLYLTPERAEGHSGFDISSFYRGKDRPSNLGRGDGRKYHEHVFVENPSVTFYMPDNSVGHAQPTPNGFPVFNLPEVVVAPTKRSATTDDIEKYSVSACCVLNEKTNVFECSRKTRGECEKVNGYFSEPGEKGTVSCDELPCPDAPAILKGKPVPPKIKMSDLPEPGTPFAGGIYFGVFGPGFSKSAAKVETGRAGTSDIVPLTDIGLNTKWALIVNGTDLGDEFNQSNLRYKHTTASEKVQKGKTSLFDGYYNTYGSDGAKKPPDSHLYRSIRSYNKFGFKDWYLPSIHELGFISDQQSNFELLVKLSENGLKSFSNRFVVLNSNYPYLTSSRKEQKNSRRNKTIFELPAANLVYTMLMVGGGPLENLTTVTGLDNLFSIRLVRRIYIEE